MTNYDREARKQFAEVVAAWADGAEIQYRRDDDEAAWQDQSHPFLLYKLSWRVKPQTIRYRVGLMSGALGRYTLVVDDEGRANLTEAEVNSYKDFVRWLTDWQEVEV